MNQKPEEDKPKKTTRDLGRGRPGWEVALREGTRGHQDYSVWDEEQKNPAAIPPPEELKGEAEQTPRRTVTASMSDRLFGNVTLREFLVTSPTRSPLEAFVNT